MHCSAKVFCAEWLQSMGHSIDTGTFDINMADLNPQELADRYLQAKQIEKFIRDAKKEMLLRRAVSMASRLRIQFVDPNRRLRL